ncbi:hypothetical protein EP7_005308 [Isosphaeraceae bacterium EP7]
MTARRRYQPDFLRQLEGRVVPSSVSVKPTDLVGGLNRGRAIVPVKQTTADQINSAFDRFTTDYLQAQSAYVVSSTPPPTPLPRNYQSPLQRFTTQRVNLLSQELIQVMSRLPGSFSRVSNGPFGGSSVTLQSFLQRRITGQTSPQSLLRGLNSIPVTTATTGTSAPGRTLDTLTATNTIEAARIATLNGAQFLRNGDFSRHR